MHYLYQGTWQNEILRFLDDSRLRSIKKQGKSAVCKDLVWAWILSVNPRCGRIWCDARSVFLVPRPRFPSCVRRLHKKLPKTLRWSVKGGSSAMTMWWAFGTFACTWIMDVQLGLSYGNVFTWVLFVRKSWMNGWELLALLHSGAWTGYSSTRLWWPTNPYPSDSTNWKFCLQACFP